MKVFVTGGAGYVGSFAVKKLLEEGHKVVVFDNLENGHREVVSKLGAQLIKGDLRNREDIEVAGADAVMHFAAYACVGESTKNPPRYFQNNVAATLNLLGAMVEHGVKKFIFSSSSEVYGEAEKLPLTEDMPLKSDNPYGLSKLMVEQILPWYDHYAQIKYVALRYFNAAGAALDGSMGEDHDPETHLVPNVILGALGRGEFKLTCATGLDTPDGTPIRDYTHVLDIADAHIRALDYLADDGKSDVFNVGRGHGYSVLEVIKEVERVSGKKIPQERGEKREGEPSAKWASNEKIKKVLGWRPNYGLKEIAESAYLWHQK